MASDKQILQDWIEFRHRLLIETEIISSDEGNILKHKKQLEKNTPEWIRFFFPGSAKCDFAPFHKRFYRRVEDNPEWYEVLSWSRELSKTTSVMFAVLKLALTGRKKNVLCISNSYDNAERILEPYRAHLDTNQRIRMYYGDQFQIGRWEKGDFRTRTGCNFRACGALQSPRGTKSIEDIRPDVIILDDFDTDEECRNPDIVKQKWDWFEAAVYGTRSISNDCLIIWCGNIIARDCCIVRAGKMADNWDIVNIRDKDGKSTWPAKNSEERIDRALSKISLRAQQQEYFNNPLAEGEIFKEMVWGKCPPIRKLDYIISYADPSTSNKDKRKTGTSFKANFLVGYCDGKFYVYTGYLDQVTNAEFVEWNYNLRDYVRGRTQILYYIENNTLQDPFYEQVYIPLFQRLGKERGFIPITPDKRAKPDKAVRIEGNLQPLNYNGQLILNETESENPHMRRLEEQFKLFTMQLKAPADGPDCIEGAVFIINERIRELYEFPSFGKYQHKNLY
ncbi:MAG: hypothetical protein LBD76_01810 [Prevotellaceae bacterium]|nr:hypothetical protein [Prevotellaceae bacterium]